MTTPTRVRAPLALAAIGALALAFGGGITAAYAAPGDIDPDATRSLTIHKQEAGTQTATGAPDGSVSTGGTPIAGVTFTAYQITNVDLLQSAGWAQLDGLTVPASACDTPSLTLADGVTAATFATGVETAATDANGMTTVPNPALAAYLICETTTPADVKYAAAPFVVTIPTTMDDANWIYQVNVYPKNVLTHGVAKYVEQTPVALAAGDQLTYSVEEWIPSLGEGEHFQHFIIEDQLSTGLTPATDWASVTLNPSVGDAIIFTRNTDYVLTETADPDTLWVGLTEAGMAQLEANPHATLAVEFTMQVTVPSDGTISNSANLYFTLGSSVPVDPPTSNPGSTPEPSETAVTYVGDYRFTKTDVENNAALSGATFEVYAATVDTQWPVSDSCAAAVKTGDPLSFTLGADIVTELTADANGIVHVPSLFIDTASSADGSVLPTHNSRCYVLVETAAPVGYTLPADADFPVLVKAGVTSDPLDPAITNTRTALPDIPLTGALGQTLLIAGGIALLLVAGGFAVVGYRRKRAPQA